MKGKDPGLKEIKREIELLKNIRKNKITPPKGEKPTSPTL